MIELDDRTLSLLIHADSKVGKTTLAATSPTPTLIIDAEGGTKFLPGSPYLKDLLGRPYRITRWNPVEPPPRDDGSWDACVATVRRWEDVRLLYQWAASDQHDFRSIAIDSITEIQRRCKTNLKGTEQMKIQDWGQLLDLMDAVIRGFRDLTMDDRNSIQVVTFIAETRQNQDGRWTPYLQGQIAVALPYWVDVCGYLYVEQLVDTNGQPTAKVRRLLVSPHPQFVAGERVQGLLGDVVDSPNVEHMLDTIYPQGESES